MNDPVFFEKGIEKFGSRSDKEMVDELQKIHERGTFSPVKKEDILTGDLKNVLESHMFLKHKRDNTIKCRLVSGGDNQRNHFDKHDLSSPTTSTEYLFYLLQCLHLNIGQSLQPTFLTHSRRRICLVINKVCT